jgi:hypothetical protein
MKYTSSLAVLALLGKVSAVELMRYSVYEDPEYYQV